MNLKELIEDGNILDFAVSDEALEHAAADKIFSLGNCTEARMCQAPNFSSPVHATKPDGARCPIGANRIHRRLRLSQWRLAAGALAAATWPYYDYGYYNGYDYGDSDAVAYCIRRFKSYDPASGTYLGYDGRVIHVPEQATRHCDVRFGSTC